MIGNRNQRIENSIASCHTLYPDSYTLYKKDSPHGRAARVMLSVLNLVQIARFVNAGVLSEIQRVIALIGDAIKHTEEVSQFLQLGFTYT